MRYIQKCVIAIFCALCMQAILAQGAEQGSCAKVFANVVATIDAMMNLRKPNIAGYTEGLRSMLPKGPCDIEAVRKISMKSTYFRWRKVYSSGEMFRLSSKYLVSDFWIDTKTNEFSKKSISIRIKIEEADFK